MKFVFLWSVILLLNTLAAAHQQQTIVNSMKQVPQGPCAIAIGVINGSPKISCPGTSPEIVAYLIRELEKEKLSNQELLVKLEDLRRKYDKLLEDLAAAKIGDGLEARVKDLISKGKFPEARAILDDIVSQEELGLKKFAERRVISARMYELGGEKDKAIEDYKKAYELYPQNPDHILMYGNALISSGQHVQAEPILNSALSAYRNKLSKDIKSQFGLALTFNSLGVVYRYTHRIAEAEESYIKSLKKLSGAT